MQIWHSFEPNVTPNVLLFVLLCFVFSVFVENAKQDRSSWCLVSAASRSHVAPSELFMTAAVQLRQTAVSLWLLVKRVLMWGLWYTKSTLLTVSLFHKWLNWAFSVFPEARHLFLWPSLTFSSEVSLHEKCMKVHSHWCPPAPCGINALFSNTVWSPAVEYICCSLQITETYLELVWTETCHRWNSGQLPRWPLWKGFVLLKKKRRGRAGSPLWGWWLSFIIRAAPAELIIRGQLSLSAGCLQAAEEQGNLNNISHYLPTSCCPADAAADTGGGRPPLD